MRKLPGKPTEVDAKPGGARPAPSKVDLQQARLKAALRANLRRRKDQARGRVRDDSGDDSGDGSGINADEPAQIAVNEPDKPEQQ